MNTFKQYFDKKYYYCSNCKDIEDGNEVNEIVDWDYLQYPEKTYFHNPKYQITKKQFFKMVITPIDRYDFYGFNPNLDIVFGYNFEDDRHDFYKK